MAHRNSFRSSCDILEIEEELNSSDRYKASGRRSKGKHLRSLPSNGDRTSSLEEDLNQLFEIFNRQNPSNGAVQSPRNGMSPSKKKASKKPIRAPSFELGVPERTSLKQAFRGLCISQASQTASVKKSAKSGSSSKASQAKMVYKNVAVEDSSSKPMVSKENLLEISFVPEEQAPSISGGRASFKRKEEAYESINDLPEQNSLPAYSPNGKIPLQPEVEAPSSLLVSSSPILDDSLLRAAKNSPVTGSASRQSSSEILHMDEPADTRTETVPGSPVSGFQTSKIEILHKEDHAMNKLGSAAKLSKLDNKTSAKKHTKSVSRLVKPVIKTKNFVKRKSKRDKASAHSLKDTRSEFNNVLYPGSSHVVCPRCHCILNDEWEEVEEEAPLSPGASPAAELSLSPLSAVLSPCAESPDNVFSDIGKPTFCLNGTNKSKEAVRENGNLKLREVGEFTQKSKSSPEECSSISISRESNFARLSSWDRPHMSRDARWQAIRQIKMQHGSVGLKNFHLLKKLGCGDIGTVYLAELIDTNCLFAIKVMDNNFLARRKKIVRAQTEREILRMLDHPFLPTLFSQFTSDNLSCLVMEYCPGGDLHVLRQMQPGRCFTEEATRFYVAEVLLALEYLHMLGVIYRDLKPENILVREDGHIMLSDFDLSLRCSVNPTLLVSPSTSNASKSASEPYKNASCVEPFCVREPSYKVSCFGPKILRRRKNKPRKPKPEQTDLLKPLLQLVAEPTDARSNSFVGTHEYLAPEIIKGEGHGSAVDWWTLGVFLYELLYGRTPFRGSENEETLANVVLQSLKFPDSPSVSLQARDLIVELLAKDPEGRLGSVRGAAEIKQHPFFEGLNWALIRCAVPPELPEFHRINGVGKGAGNANNSSNNKYLEYNASTGAHLEFEVF